MIKPKPRFKAFFLARQREDAEVPWVRTSDLVDLELPRPLVLVDGAFDLLTSAHMRLLFAAREKAKSLILALESDELVRAKKGLGRPILHWVERAAQMHYMPVDYVVEVGSREDLSALIRVVKPDLRVYGMDRSAEKSRFQTPKMIVRNGGLHTTDIIERIKEKLIDGKLD